MKDEKSENEIEERHFKKNERLFSSNNLLFDSKERSLKMKRKQYLISTDAFSNISSNQQLHFFFSQGSSFYRWKETLSLKNKHKKMTTPDLMLTTTTTIFGCKFNWKNWEQWHVCKAAEIFLCSVLFLQYVPWLLFFKKFYL